MNKSEMFKKAHSEARDSMDCKTFDSYKEAFSFNLQIIWNEARNVTAKSDYANWTVSEIQAAIVFDAARIATGLFTQLTIIEDVAEKSKGFQSDIAKRVLESGRISEKQAWCVAYEAKKIA
jgi:hypothetical protein